MKFLAICCVLLPCLAWSLPASSTEKWDKEGDDAFTLETTPKENQEDAKIGRVPLSKSEGPAIIKQDEIFPMILQQLMEESLRNEVKGSDKMKTPLTYMTPPSAPLKQDNGWTDDEVDSVTTTTENLPDFQEKQTGSGSTAAAEDSQELSETSLPKTSEQPELEWQKYAEKYNQYITKNRDSVDHSEELEHQPSTHSLQHQEPETGFHNMDKFVLDSSQKPQVPEEPSESDEPTTSAPIFLDHTIPEQPETTSEQTVEEPDSKTDNRPIYYVIFRPKNSEMDTFSKFNMRPQPYWSNSISSNNWNVPMRRSYRYPSYLAQDYEDQIPSSAQYYPRSSPMTYQPRSFYNDMPYNYPQYPSMQMTPQTYDSPYYNNYYNNRDMYSSASSFSPYTPFYRMTRSPSYSFFPQTYNNYNRYQQEQPYENFRMRAFNGFDGYQNMYYA